MSRLSSLSCVCLLALAACGGDPGVTTDGGTGSSADTSSTATTTAPTTGAPTTGADGSSSGTGGPGELDPRLSDCLRINACEADGGAPMGLQACLAHALDVPWTWASVGPTRIAVEAMACKLAAADCETVRACTPPLEPFTDVCKDSIGGGLCDGDRWVFCDELGAPAAALDCAAAGQTCGVDVWAGCGLEPCEFGVTEATCDPDAPDVLVECSPAGFLTRVDCRTQNNLVIVGGKGGDSVFTIAGETCGYDPMRGANACVGTGEACDWFSQRCDGDVLETCAGGKLGRRDCATLEPAGQGCGFLTGGPFAGAASCGLVDPTCSLDGDETCQDGVIGFCDWDRPGTLDCVAAGYGGCASAQLGERTVAYCVP